MMWPEVAVLLLLLVQTSHARYLPSSCGNITEISYPFRLKGDLEKCGESLQLHWVYKEKYYWGDQTPMRPESNQVRH